MKILVQLPTFARAEKFLRVLDLYIETASSHNDVVFNINCDIEDETMTDEYVKERTGGLQQIAKDTAARYADSMHRHVEAAMQMSKACQQCKKRRSSHAGGLWGQSHLCDMLPNRPTCNTRGTTTR